MKLVFWASLLIIAYTYAGYPIAMALLAKFFPWPWKRGPELLNEDQPPVSIVMAVHNGAAMLPASLEHLLSLEPHLVREVVVVSDGSSDATAGILRAKNDPRLKTLILERQGGKATALNHGIAAATGRILLFVDIRPRVQPGAIAELLTNFADPRVGCVAGELVLTSESHDATASAVSGVYWRYEQWIRNCEAAFDSPVGVYGGFYAVRRELASPAPDGTILDDMYQPLAIIARGYRSVLDRNAIVTDVWPAKAKGEFNRKVRTLAGNFQLISLAPWILSPKNRVVFQLVSHKLLRLVVPYFFVLLLLSSTWIAATKGPGSLFFLCFAIVQAVLWLMAAVQLVRPLGALGKVASPASAMLVLNAAAVVGLYKFLFTRAPLWTIWSPTAAPE